MAIELPQEIIAFQRGGLAGVIKNLIMALNHFYTLDHLTCAVASAGYVAIPLLFAWFPQKSIGEYTLACFFACTVLVSEGLVAEDTIICLWKCGTQIIKSGVYLCGMTALFLAALRAFGDALQAMKKSEACFAACRYDGNVLSGVSGGLYSL